VQVALDLPAECSSDRCIVQIFSAFKHYHGRSAINVFLTPLIDDVCSK
jgi:hypothetical protein